MSYQMEHVIEKEVWEQAILSFPEANFLQSFNWGTFHERLGKSIVRLLIKNEGMVVGMVEGVIEKARRGTYLTIAGGPLVDWHNRELLTWLFGELGRVAKDRGCTFIRFRPQALDAVELHELVGSLGCMLSPMHVTADLTLQLDLSKTDELLLSEMRKNHRSLIRRAERDGVTTTVSTDQTEIKRFFDQQVAVANKHGFVPFSYQFLNEQFGVFVADGQVALIHAWKDTTLLASAFVIFYHGEAVYHYGISTDANSEYPGSYAAQWAAILEAKKRGCLRYNFWGIAPIDQTNHRFAGVSMFKRGFGGEEVMYLPAHDLPLGMLYWPTYAFEMLRKKLRRL